MRYLRIITSAPKGALKWNSALLGIKSDRPTKQKDKRFTREITLSITVGRSRWITSI